MRFRTDYVDECCEEMFGHQDWAYFSTLDAEKRAKASEDKLIVVFFAKPRIEYLKQLSEDRDEDEESKFDLVTPDDKRSLDECCEEMFDHADWTFYEWLTAEEKAGISDKDMVVVFFFEARPEFLEEFGDNLDEDDDNLDEDDDTG